MLLLFALLASTSAAPAAATPAAEVSSAFGNTIVTIDPDGRARKIWLRPDGSWTGRSRRGLELAGHWKVRADKVCLTQSKPPLFGSMCERLPTDPKVGFQTKDPTGKVIQIKLVRGHVEQYPPPSRAAHGHARSRSQARADASR